METIELVNYGFLAITAYSGALLTLKTIQEEFSPRIENERHLQDVVNREAPKLGLEPKEISVNYEAHPRRPNTSCAGRNKDGELAVWMHPSATEKQVKHELYHLFRDCKKEEKRIPVLGILKYIFISEPRADLYGALGIKL